MKIVTSLILILCSLLSWGQKEMNFNDISMSDEGILIESDGTPVDGNYKLKRDREEFSYTYSNYNNGLEHGYFRTHASDGYLLFESLYFYGNELYLKKFDEKGNVVIEEKYYEILSSDKPNKRGQFENGKLKLKTLTSSWYSNYSKGDIVEYELDEGVITAITETIHYPNGNVRERNYYPDEPALPRRELFKPNGNSLITIQSYKTFNLNEYPNDGGYPLTRIIELGNGLMKWTDASGNPLNGNYKFSDFGSAISGLYTFKDGFEHGKIYQFDDAGLLEKTWEYEDGKLHGQVIDLSFGNYKITTYRDGVQHGLEYKLSMEQGIVTDSVYYENGNKTGTEMKRYTGDEKEVSTISYKNGEKHGKVETTALTNGGKRYLKQVEFYQLGKKTGKHQEFDSLGNTISETNYKFDKEHGLNWWIYEGERSESTYKLGKIIANKSYNREGKLKEEWYLEGRRTIGLSYHTNGKLKERTSDYDMSEIQLGDTTIYELFDESGRLFQKEVKIVETEGNWDPDNYWRYTFDKKGKLAAKYYIMEEYPDHTIREFDVDRVVKETFEPMFPDHEQMRTIKYFGKKGEIIKVCTETFYDINEYDDIDGVWEKADCND